MEISTTWYILPAAFALDLALGDPRFLPHPIRWMGKAISFLEPFFRKLPTGLIVSGALFAVSLVAAAWSLTSLVIHAADAVDPIFRNIIEVLLIFYAISARSLEDSALEVYRPLKLNRLQQARSGLASIVGRDVIDLKQDGIARAAVETVAENLVDGVVSPLFYAAIGGAPLAMAYKMINTLDSMIGYKNDAYRHFGKTAAKIDDIANFIPARLAIPVISMAAEILVRKGFSACATALSEGANHSSPNAGYPEAAFAGALNVELGGPSYYHGRLVDKPHIGTGYGKAAPNHIKKACDLMMLSALIWLAISWGIMIIL